MCITLCVVACRVKIHCGLEGGLTLGTPIMMYVANEDTKPSDYSEMVTTPRPGHADYTYKACACESSSCATM